jgi:Ca-activated chloride channel family protein
MYWAFPERWTLLWVLPILTVVGLWAGWRARRHLRRFADEALLVSLASEVSHGRRWFKVGLFLMGLGAVLVALLGPQWGIEWQEITHKGTDVIVALDVSRSMLVEDVKPSRLGRAKLAIRDMVQGMQGDRIGLVVFSAVAYEQCPLTADYDSFALLLEAADPEDMRHGGSALAPAVAGSLKIFASGAQGRRALVVVSDGGEGGEDFSAVIKQARQAGVVIYTVGVGTPEGDLIPVRDAQGRLQYAKDGQGRVVKSRLNEQPLRQLAAGTGGVYLRGAGVGFGLDRIYSEHIRHLEDQAYESQMQQQRIHRFQWPLAAAFVLLLLEPVVADVKRLGRVL